MAGNSSDERARRVLVTGASGFIGRELVGQLLQANYRVRILARDPSTLAAVPWKEAVEVVTGDITRDGLTASCKNVGTVIHCAGFAHSGKGSRQKHDAINRDGTRRLLDAAIDSEVRRFLFISSSKVLSARPTPYAQAKGAAEALVFAAHEQGRIEVCCLRPAAVYGRGMKGSLAGWIGLLRKGLAPPLPPVRTRLAMIGLQDLCGAALRTLECPDAWGKCYLLSDGEAYQVKELETRIRSALGGKPFRWHVPRPVFAAAAAVSEWAGHLPGMHSPFGRSGYNTLFFDEYAEDPRFQADTGFVPRQNFYAELPGILQEQ